jgi:hypothetical protein
MIDISSKFARSHRGRIQRQRIIGLLALSAEQASNFSQSAKS